MDPIKSVFVFVQIVLFASSIFAEDEKPLNRPRRWALDATDDYVNTQFRFYNYNTQLCISVDSSGTFHSGGICEDSKEIFTFKIEDCTFWEDALNDYNTIKVIKFIHKDTGKCMSGSGSSVVLENCAVNSVNQSWRKVNSWQGARLYLVISNLGRNGDLSGDSSDPYGGVPTIQPLDYSNDDQWWQLASA